MSPLARQTCVALRCNVGSSVCCSPTAAAGGRCGARQPKRRGFAPAHSRRVRACVRARAHTCDPTIQEAEICNEVLEECSLDAGYGTWRFKITRKGKKLDNTQVSEDAAGLARMWPQRSLKARVVCCRTQESLREGKC